MANCPNCNSEIAWDNDFNFEDYCLEGEGLVQEYHCNNCGAQITVKIEDKDISENLEEIEDYER